MKLSVFAAAIVAAAALVSCASAPSAPRAAAPADLVPAGFWTATVDPESTQVPATGATNDTLYKDVDGQKAVSVTWTIKPDKENGGDIWTFGELDGTFTADKKAADLSKVKLVVTYSSDTPAFARVILDPPVTEDGGQHINPLKSTDGKMVTVELNKNDFIQPAWLTHHVPVDWTSITTIQFGPDLRGGGVCHFILKSLKLVPAN